MQIKSLVNVSLVLIISLHIASAQTPNSPQPGNVVDGLQMTITTAGLIRTGVPNLQVTFRNVTDSDLNLNLGTIGGYSPRPCKLDNRNIPCTFNFKLNITDSDGAVRTYTFRGITFVAGRLDPYIVQVKARSTYTLELGIDQFWSPATRDYQALALTPGTNKLSLEFEGQELGLVNSGQEYLSKLIFWKGKVTSNSLTVEIARGSRTAPLSGLNVNQIDAGDY